MLVSPSSRVPTSSTTACTSVPIDAATPDGGDGDVVDEPAERRLLGAVDLRRRDRHECLGVAVEVDERSDRRRVGESVPVGRVGAGHPRLGEQGERRRSLARRRGHRLVAERADEPAQVQGTPPSRTDALGRVAHEHRRLLVVVGRAAEHQLSLGARGREGEQAQLVAAHRRARLGDALGRGRRGTRSRGSRGAGEESGVQERAARAQVRPHPVLQTGDDDHVERAADERGRRGDEHRFGAALRGERVFGQLAREHLVDESHGRRVGLALGMTLRRGEQRDRRVERPVRLVGEHAGAAGLCAPLGGEAAALPQRPQHLLDRAPADGDGTRAAEHLREPCRPTGGRGIDRLEAARRGERVDEQLVARAVAARRELVMPQRQAQAPQADAVEPPDGPGEQRRPRVRA